MAAFGESHHLFMLCPPSTTATKQTAEAAAQHKQELTQTQCSLLVFKLGNVLNFGQLLHLPKFKRDGCWQMPTYPLVKGRQKLQLTVRNLHRPSKHVKVERSWTIDLHLHTSHDSCHRRIHETSLTRSFRGRICGMSWVSITVPLSSSCQCQVWSTWSFLQYVFPHP